MNFEQVLSSCHVDVACEVLTAVVRTEAASVAAFLVAAYPEVAWNLEACHVEALH